MGSTCDLAAVQGERDGDSHNLSNALGTGWERARAKTKLSAYFLVERAGRRSVDGERVDSYAPVPALDFPPAGAESSYGAEPKWQMRSSRTR